MCNGVIFIFLLYKDIKMEEKTKKRSRKTKLVPREYVDSDDENIAKMQVGPPGTIL